MEQTGGSTEHTGTCRDSVAERFDRLTDAYRCIADGSRPRQDATDLARAIFAAVVGENGGCYSGVRTAELTCISLTLVEKMSRSLRAQDQTTELTSHCEEILRELFQDMDLMSQLVQQFQAEDQITSHLAAKAASTRVFSDLHTFGLISPAWQQKCVQVFHSSAPSTELDSCLWSLTEVLKRLLRERSEILGKLLSAFDSSLSSLCCRFLPIESEEATRHWANTSARWGTTFCLLLDLLEALTASGLIIGAGSCLRSQRLTYVHSSALLWTVTGSSEQFVKKRVLLLLKRVVLQKAGEDWDLAERLLTRDQSSSDMIMLAQSVLRAVAADWLQHVQVESASFFGGSTGQGGGRGGGQVMLRAISLLLLKSLELHTQTAAGTGPLGATECYRFLQTLWDFLRRCSVQRTEVVHCCRWVSLLFGEQDDDMMEAAKALLSIFLHHRTSSGPDDPATLEAACAAGCNPHCHFLLLLQSVSFDHSILLDFLISAETCFLEYFVRYLKYLLADRRGFAAACRRASRTASCGAATSRPACRQKTGPGSCPDPVVSGFCLQPTTLLPPVHGLSSPPGLRLVEYDSSEESDPENMEVTEDSQESWKKPTGLEASVCDREVINETCRSPVSIRQTEHVPSDWTVLQNDPNSSLERRFGGLAPAASCETSVRAMLCLSELRQVVTRLQAKKLFPYNPSSLLKLLGQLDKISNH